MQVSTLYLVVISLQFLLVNKLIHENVDSDINSVYGRKDMQVERIV
jgi:hypothetical protein